MSSQIDSKILEKLRAFAARRRKLILWRGLFTAVALLLATMMVVAAVDWVFVLADELRWALSGLAYLSVLIAEWSTCLRLLTKAPGPRQLARLLEHAEPRLREDLLSAVELGTSDEAVFDSVQFRQLLQSDVSSRLETVDVERLLPLHLLRRYLGILAAIVVALLIGFALSGFQFGTLLARAFLPMANLARVSKFQVRIVEPAPAEAVVPFGEAVPLTVAILGGHVSKVTLETFTKSGGREVMPMSAVEQDHFTASLQVAREDVEYRIRAGDAMTRKFRLRAQPRPQIVSFEKNYTYPDYVKRENKQSREENGDLTALEGSLAELRLNADQSISSAELRVEQGAKKYTVPLNLEQGRTLVAKLPMDISGSYRVHLVAGTTGFENKFSPEYQIRVEPDLVPQVELESPKVDLLLAASEVVDLRANASDDQGLAKIAQWIRINEGPWQEVILGKEVGIKWELERRWDLFELGVKPGDLITTKLAATDLKGSRSESRQLQITITEGSGETLRMQGVESQRKLLRALGELRVRAEALEQTGGQARGIFGNGNEGEVSRKQALAAVRTGLSETEAKVDVSWNELLSTVRGASDSSQSGQFVLLGRLLTRLGTGGLALGGESLDLALVDPMSAGARDRVNEMASSISRAVQWIRAAHDACRTFLAGTELELMCANFERVSVEQGRLLSLAEASGEDAQKWAQIGNRIRVVVAETRSLQDLMEASHEHFQAHHDPIRRLKSEVEKSGLVVEKVLAAGAASKGLLEPIQRLGKATNQAMRQLYDIRRDLVGHEVRVASDLGRQVETTYLNFDRLRADWQQLANRAGAGQPESIRRDWCLENRQRAFKMHGDVEEARPGADTYFVSDVRATSLGLLGLREMERLKAKEAVDGLEKSFRLLEGGHEVFELLEALKQFSTAERWELKGAQARTSAPKNWEWIESRLRGLPEQFGRQGQDEGSRKLFAEAQRGLQRIGNEPAARQIDQEMRERFRLERPVVSVQPDCDRLAAMVAEVLKGLRPAMEEARNVMAQAAPKLHERMAQLAREAEALKEETRKKTGELENQPAAEAQKQVAQTQARQEQLNADVGALKDAVRAEANRMDLAQKENRERARDADDALAMLKEPPVRAAQALEEAQAASDPGMRKESMNSAVKQQQKLEQALDQLAKHYANVEAGKGEESRTALRDTERAEGLKEALDAQYAKAEQMAEMATDTPQELLAKLEKALATSPTMQKELSEISRDLLGEAEQRLGQANEKEGLVAKQVKQLAAQQEAAKPQESSPAQPSGNPPTVPPATEPAPGEPAAPKPAEMPNPQLAQAAKQQAPIGATTAEAAEQISRAGRHEQRMQNPVAGEALEKLGEKVSQTAKSEVAKAEATLNKAQQAAESLPAVEAAERQLATNLGQLRAAAQAAPESAAMKAPASPNEAAAPGQTAEAATAQAKPAESKPGQAEPGQNSQSPAALTKPEQKWMARTLDALDAALHNENAAQSAEAKAQASPSGEPKQSQPAQAGQQSQAGQQPGADAAAQKLAQAQSAMAAAAQAAADAIRASRGESSEQKPSGEMAQGGQQSRSKTGSKVDGSAKGYGALPENRTAKAGDWGKLPKKVAEELSQGQRENVPGEYRNQIEAYYRVIAERSKK